MKINDLLSFSPHGRDRETLPCFPSSIVGHPIECSDQSGTLRLLPGDRVRLAEIRADHALVKHASLKGCVLLTSLSQLQPIAEAPDTMQEDAAL